MTMKAMNTEMRAIATMTTIMKVMNIAMVTVTTPKQVRGRLKNRW